MAKELKARLSVRVHAQARCSRLNGMMAGSYKLDVTAPASDGRANEACIELLASLTKTPLRHIRLITGQTSRSKIFEFEGIEIDELRRRLDQAL